MTAMRLTTGRMSELKTHLSTGGGSWIQGAIEHPGSFRESAEKAGESTHEYAEEHKHDSGTLGRRARLALTLGKMHHK